MQALLKPKNKVSDTTLMCLNLFADRYICKPEDQRINDVNNADAPYVCRWIVAKNPLFKVFIHKIARSEDLGVFHDHPWPFLSIMLKGSYIEEIKKEGGACERALVKPGNFVLRKPGTPHRLELIDDQPCWTFFCCGPQVREWRFHDGC
jgi:hypothetical protein